MIREIIMGGLILLGYYRTKEDDDRSKLENLKNLYRELLGINKNPFAFDFVFQKLYEISPSGDFSDPKAQKEFEKLLNYYTGEGAIRELEMANYFDINHGGMFNIYNLINKRLQWLGLEGNRVLDQQGNPMQYDIDDLKMEIYKHLTEDGVFKDWEIDIYEKGLPKQQAKAMRSQKSESLREQGAFDHWSGPIIVGGPSPKEVLRRSLVIIGK